MDSITSKAINAIRMLSADAIQKATSGHPGLPLGAAPMAYELWANHMTHNPKNPKFFNRDRFVLSAGHGSMLLYSLLHLFGYGLEIEDIKNFRQLNSKTPGHPEYGHTAGVETTTGPLGQGVANAVGMAIAESMLAARFNKDGFNIVDHYTYVIAGDGCMMEGIESEAASLAGTLKLGKLIVLYDSNDISIEGNINIAFCEDVAARHKAQGWDIQYVKDGNDLEELSKAINAAKAAKDKPSLIVVKTQIGYGSPLAGTHDCHGSPLGEENIKKTREFLGWNYEPFEVPSEVYEHYNNLAKRGIEAEERWNNLVQKYKELYPQEYDEFMGMLENKIPELVKIESLWEFADKADATRNSSGIILNKLADILPNLIGGSADLSPSTKTYLKNKGSYSADNRVGRNLHFGVREHAMAAVCNGIYLHGGFNVFCSTFFVFSDYMKNAIRLSALMNIPVIYVLTHDSIGVGEDGPTHQPIEHLIALRAIPNLKVFRPADGCETTAAYISALSGTSPTAIVLSRQNLPQLNADGRGALKGGYVLSDCEGEPDVILMASGSEVEVILKAQELLKEQGVKSRVVSMPCMEVFEAQSPEYKESVLPDRIRARVAVEAGSSYSWHKYTGLDGKVLGVDSFGASAPAKQLFELYGLTAENVANAAKELLKK
ncbi:MAG: transketolase [Clostridiales bacterium]|jgi:transketolase|nr:transketolase [Clostridiales bacterium]